MSVYMVVGQNIRKLRKQHGYTQERLANELFMSACNLRNIERGRGNPRLETLERISQQLGVPVQSLFEERKR